MGFLMEYAGFVNLAPRLVRARKSACCIRRVGFRLSKSGHNHIGSGWSAQRIKDYKFRIDRVRYRFERPLALILRFSMTDELAVCDPSAAFMGTRPPPQS